MNRRKALELIMNGFAGCVLINPAISNSKTYDVDKRIADYKIKLIDNFTLDEKNDILEILSSYEKIGGNMKKYSFSFGKEKLSSIAYNVCDANSIFSCDKEELEMPMRGYLYAGRTNPKSLEISVAPKQIIDAQDKWEHDKNKMPVGEEGRRHNFRWVIAHELAHAISFKLGFGYELMNLMGPKEPSEFYKIWYNLDKDIAANCEPLAYNSDNGEWENKRPEGFPTRYSYFARNGASRLHELFAEVSAYIITNSHYADNDKWLMRRVELANKKFTEIKKKQPRVLTPEECMKLGG